MVVRLMQTIGDLPESYIMGAILLPVLFLGWVIMSERRTRHLTQLIRAVRGQVRSTGGSRMRDREGR
ncbi:hypothetical protein Q3W71_20485 [Micromonospora sp. C28SCA-DRY-2]|uniref:hypothetical protein n=1 Tax=Micromonospora sp. C28SCA-DRY-2 TaxID=3059522 RepID=UPI002674C67F|nr:hypothetical protein [Micromonospora sp. C28SCA-DRY-2]MDO3704047.1 hypothetical protein [Micromonospora sp. C28SCA-DRY-2]